MYRYIKKHMWFFIGTAILTIFTNVLLTGSSVIQQRLIDSVTGMNLQLVKMYVVVIIVYRVAAGALYMLSQITQRLFGDRISGDIRYAVFSGVMRRSYKDFSAVNSSEYISALTNDINSVGQSYFTILFTTFFSIAAAVTSLIIMICYQPVITAVVVVLAVIMMLAPVLLGKKIGKRNRLKSEKFAQWTTAVADFFAGFDVIFSFGMSKHVDENFRKINTELRESEYRADGLNAFSHGFAQLLSSIAQVTILVLSCYMVLRGKITIGMLMAFTSMNGSFCSNLSMLYQTFPILKGLQPIIDKVNTYADYQQEDSFGNLEPELKKELTVEGLCFGYNEEKDVLQNVSMTLAHGGKYALIGESGCGKTTLIRLLLGDYADYRGSICYDGRELHELNRNKLCGMVSVIQQEVFLFDDTVYNNICLYEDFSQEQLDRALEHSGVKKFLSELEGGLDFRVGERGERLSGGQRQRIAIARALIRNTEFLILDEGTSALDEQNASDIERELLEMPGLTLLTITHHLKNEEKYSGVLKLENGMVVA